MVFSKDGKRLAAASGDFALVWDVTTGQQLLKATHAASSETVTPQQWIVDAAMSPDGKFLAYAARGDTLARLWNIDTGRQILELKHIWSTADHARISRISLPTELTQIAFNSSGVLLFTAENENLQAWEIPSGKRRFSLTESDDIDGIPDPTSGFFATLTHGRLTVWNAVSGARLAQLPDAGYLRAAAFSPDGRCLLAGYDEDFAALWLWRSSDLQAQGCALLTTNLSHQEWTRWFPKEPYHLICPNLPPAN